MKIRTMQDLGAVIRHARTGHGKTQAELAERVGVSRDWVVRLEKGHPRLEAQLVLDALDAAGLILTLEIKTEGTVDDPTALWDDVFADLTARPTTSPDAVDTAPAKGQDPSDG